MVVMVNLGDGTMTMNGWMGKTLKAAIKQASRTRFMAQVVDTK